MERRVGVCLVLIVSSLLVRRALADTVVIPPTAPAATDAERLERSVETMRAFLSAIYNTEDVDSIDVSTPPVPYPGGSRTIQLLEGDYYLIAVVGELPDPDNPPPGFELLMLPGAPPLWRYNPLGLGPSELGHQGLPIPGVDHLTIQGAVDASGSLKTTVHGNPALTGSFPDDPRILLNAVFNFMGYFDQPSRHNRLHHLRFEDCSRCVTANGEVWFEPTALAGAGVEDLIIEDNVFRVDGLDPVNLFARVLGATIRRNLFYTDNLADTPFFPQAPINVNSGADFFHPDAPHPVGLLVEDNEFDNVMGAMRLFDFLEDVTVRNNSIQLHPNGGTGILVVAGTHGLAPLFPPAKPGNVIEDNELSGGTNGINVFGQYNWTIAYNHIVDTIRAVWIEWGPFASEAGLRFTPAENNLVFANDLTGNVVGVYLGAMARNNTVFANRLDRGDPPFRFGIVVSGPETIPLGNLTFGAATGNDITVDHPDEVLDLSSCTAGPVGCPQRDYDSSGTVNSDPIDALDNDGNGIADDDPADVPNEIGVHLCDVESGHAVVVPVHAAAALLAAGHVSGGCE